MDQYTRQERGREADGERESEGERHPEPRGEGILVGAACAFQDSVTHLSWSW